MELKKIIYKRSYSPEEDLHLYLNKEQEISRNITQKRKEKTKYKNQETGKEKQTAEVTYVLKILS